MFATSIKMRITAILSVHAFSLTNAEKRRARTGSNPVECGTIDLNAGSYTHCFAPAVTRSTIFFFINNDYIDYSIGLMFTAAS